MFISNEYNSEILYDRWYKDVDEDMRVVETTAHIMKQDINGMVYNR